ncbi:MAG: hypothetical protein F4Y04_00605, partial [Chloroflexi bacterium]|nr:hypothetical protein [Chloroflexota bacterium]
VTSQGNGTATVTATAGTLTATAGWVTASATVRVAQRVASVVIVPGDTSRLNTMGATVQLQAVARDANGHTVTVEIGWTSSDPAVATVDAGGLVTAQADGRTEIRASSGGFSDALALDLALRQAAQIVLTPSSSLLEAFEATAQLQAEVLDADGQKIAAPLDWSSSDSAIAAVDASGRITARGNGTATITARNGEAAGTATVKVLQGIRTLRITPSARYFDPLTFTSLGETLQFTFEALDPNGHVVAGADLTAASQDNDVVRIDERFLATAVANGDTKIHFLARWAGVSYSIFPDVRVRQVASSIRIDPTARTFGSVGETHRFTAVARDANGHAVPDDYVLWSTADRRVADVDPSGLVSIRGVGETTIAVATTEGLSASAAVTGEPQTTCAAGDRTPSIDSVAPGRLVEGTTFEIVGQGFCGDSRGNLVTVDRTVAAAQAMSETRLSVTVPQFHCLPSRRVELSVAVGENRVARTVDLVPDEPAVSVGIGRQALWGAGQDRCLQFRAAPDDEAYLIGVQSTSLEPAYDLTPVRLIAATSEAHASTPSGTKPQTLFPNARPIGAAAAGPSTGGTDFATLPHDLGVEALLLHSEVSPAPGHSIGAGPVAADTIEFPNYGDIESLPEEGDIVILPNSDAEWLVYNVAQHSLWLIQSELVALFEARYSAQIESLANQFDTEMYPVIADAFGAPDLGRTGRVVVRIREGGFAHPVGNSGRAWHMISINWKLFNDPMEYLQYALVHEFVHVVQQAGAWSGPHRRSLHPNWFDEGHARFGEEVYAWALANLSSAQNYGNQLLQNPGYPRTPWHSNFRLVGNFLNGRHPEQSQECSWLLPDPAPCIGSYLFYGVGWSLLRYLTDQYDRLYPGGEANLNRELIHGPDGQFDSIEKHMDEPIETL